MSQRNLSGQMIVTGLALLLVTACSPAMPAPPATSTAAATFIVTRESTATAMPTPGKVFDYVVLGDSNPYGFGVARPYAKIFADYIAEDLGIEVQLHNWASVDGETSHSLLNRLRTDERLQQDIRDAELITIDVGWNEFGPAATAFTKQKCGKTDHKACLQKMVQTYHQNLDAILNQIDDLHPDNSKVLIRTVDLYMGFCDFINYFSDAANFQGLKPFVDEFNADVDEATRAHHGQIVDLSLVFNGLDGTQNPAAYLQGDQCHLNLKGHQKVADMLRELGYEK